MKSMEIAVAPPDPPTWSPRHLEVPRTDRALLCDPPLSDAPDLEGENAAQLNRADVDFQGRSLLHLRRWARQACLREACQYTTAIVGDALEVEIDDLTQRPLYLAGHQPALYHPGVWVKNFAVDRLATATGGVGLNLVVDNDTFATTAIRVPTGSRDALSIERIPFDASRPVQPWENAEILDRGLFDTFAQRVQTTLAGGVEQGSVLQEMWPDAVAFQAESPRLVDCLTAARHRQERRWGLANLELPLSRLCETDPFLWFASHLLAHLPRFSECHNSVLHAYRRLNHVRSRNHPVPELHERDGWTEAPFWVWRTGDLMRRPVFARQQDRTLTLSDGEQEFAKLPLSPELEACCAVEELRKLPSRGIHFRTRALTTTLFARLCLGDLFVHGIGGAKYDEMTDQIIQRFFGVEPPSFLTMSATLHLPMFELYDVTEHDERSLQHQLRDITFNADRHGLGPAANALIAEKEALIAAQRAARTDGLTRRERRMRAPENRQRYGQLQRVNAELSSLASDQRNSLEHSLDEVERQLNANRVLQDREYSYGLYPPAMLREFFRSKLKLTTSPGS